MKTLTLALMVVLAISGCGDMLASKQAADKAIAKFHARYNDEKLSEIYKASDSQMKSQAKEEDFLEFMKVVRRKLGKVTQSTNLGLNVRTMNLDTVASIQQDTQFEQGRGTESFVFRISHGKAKLVGFNISSRDLIMK